jgi:hypothetical protein
MSMQFKVSEAARAAAPTVPTPAPDAVTVRNMRNTPGILSTGTEGTGIDNAGTGVERGTRFKWSSLPKDIKRLVLYFLTAEGICLLDTAQCIHSAHTMRDAAGKKDFAVLLSTLHLSRTCQSPFVLFAYDKKCKVCVCLSSPPPLIISVTRTYLSSPPPYKSLCMISWLLKREIYVPPSSRHLSNLCPHKQLGNLLPYPLALALQDLPVARWLAEHTLNGSHSTDHYYMGYVCVCVCACRLALLLPR